MENSDANTGSLTRDQSKNQGDTSHRSGIEEPHHMSIKLPNLRFKTETKTGRAINRNVAPNLPSLKTKTIPLYPDLGEDA